jgi:Holliday junction DNA helicase RuvA
MIATLRGTVLQKQPTEVIVDLSGLGLSVFVPLSTSERIGEPGSPITLLTHLVVREDALQLYGFCTQEERDLFRLLLSVSGIGPKIAQAVLSGLSAPDIRGAIASGDIRTLTRIPGVGKKLAERLVVELRDKISAAGTRGQANGSLDSPEARLREEAILALIALGYARVAAEKSIKQILADEPTLAGSLESLIKAAIRQHH